MLLNKQEPDHVIRISFLWLLIGTIFIVLLGMLGGILAGQIWPPAPPPSSSGKQDQLVTNVKEITISPNTASSESLKNAERSVVALVKDNATLDRFAMGVVVTNDGLIVTSANVPSGPVIAMDYRGAKIPLDVVGSDQLFGLTYFRVKDQILSPLDVRSEDIPLAYKLLAISRANVTFLPIALSYQVTEVTLPPQVRPVGIQRLFAGQTYPDQSLAGSALIDDEGQLAALLINPPAGLALPGSQLLESVQRVANGQREFDPFLELGFSVNYRFTFDEKTKDRQFAAEVVNIVPQSAAAQAGLQKKDIVLQVNNQPLAWQTSFTKMLSEKKPVTLIIRRGLQEMNVNLSN